MTPLLFAFALVQAAPTPAASQVPAPAVAAPAAQPVAAPVEAPPPTPQETLEGLQQVYASTCGQTGILYHAYDDMCDGLRKQIHAYQNKIDRAANAKPTKVSTAAPPKR